MDEQQRRQFERVIEISSLMLSRARENDWEQVATLEAQRQPMLAKCFARVPVDADASDVAEAIRQILLLNDEMATLGIRHRETLGGDIRNSKIGRKATAAYRDCV